MNVQNRAPTRAKLSLPFGRSAPEQAETSPGLSKPELRRIVAAMIG
jgi:hypothetical protein